MRRPKWTGEILNLHIKVTKITNRRVTPCKHKYLHTPPTLRAITWTPPPFLYETAHFGNAFEKLAQSIIFKSN